jgi:hypothetical protein
MSKLFVLAIACAALARAQGSSLSITTSVAPAAETVTATSTPANVPLFDRETVQLTDNVISELQTNPDVATFASLFEFGDANTTSAERTRRARSAQRCKTMPGDALYPSKPVWALIGLLLGGALEPVVPIGSPCYPNSTYHNYDAERCAYLVKNQLAEEP